MVQFSIAVSKLGNSTDITAGRTNSVVSSAGTTTLPYDYEGRISTITYPSTATNTFKYNGLDTRVSKVDSAGTSTYKRDGAGVTAPVLSDASAVYTPGISERRSSTTTYLHSGLKNADSQSGTGQTIAATKQYDAFGNVLSSTGTWKGPFGYAGSFGYQEDSDSSLKLLGHRYYDSSTGRFLTRDPIKDGRNWYVYCENNPINCVDARGLDTLIFNRTTLKHYDSSGHLIDIYPAASGMPGTGKNDQDKKGGPIPEGTYYLSPRKAEFASINPIEISQSGYFPPSKSWGNARVELWQLAGDAKFGRKAFYLHGGTDVGSAGCIDVGPNDEKIIGRLRRINRPDVKVIVDYSNWNGTVPKPAKQW